MKKVIALLLAVCMVLSMGAVVMAEGVSGEFTGTAQGLGGDVTVTLTIEDGKMTKSLSLISTCEHPVILNSLDFIKAIRETLDSLL